jgi:hypothetical protein
MADAEGFVVRNAMGSSISVSQREQPHDRALRKMAKLRQQLPGLGKGSLDKKPRGWHRSTWEEWIAAYRSAIERTDKVKFIAQLGLGRL